MKKKIIIASATVFFAVATMFNMNLLQGNSLGDVSLDAIAVMAQAQNENNNKAEWELDVSQEYYWHFTYSCFPPNLEFSKESGHKATCSNTGNCINSCIHKVHSARPNDTCADCNSYSCN